MRYGFSQISRRWKFWWSAFLWRVLRPAFRSALHFPIELFSIFLQTLVAHMVAFYLFLYQSWMHVPICHRSLFGVSQRTRLSLSLITHSSSLITYHSSPSLTAIANRLSLIAYPLLHIAFCQSLIPIAHCLTLNAIAHHYRLSLLLFAMAYRSWCCLPVGSSLRQPKNKRLGDNR